MNFRNFHKNRKLRFAISQTTQLDFGGGSQFRKQRNWVLEGVSQFRKQRNRVSSLFYNSDYFIGILSHVSTEKNNMNIKI